VLPRWLSSAIIIVVTLAWAVNFLAQFVMNEYKPDPLVHALFMSIVGGALALSRKGNGGNDGDGP